VAQPGDRPGLLLEARQRGRTPEEVGPEELDGQPALQVLVVHLVHLGESTAAEQADDAVLPPQRPSQLGSAVGLAGGGQVTGVVGAEQREAARPAPGAVDRAVGEGGVAGRTD
jgi:hypothetical protein